MSKTHKLVVTGVVTTIATAAVLTFTRGDTAPADSIAALPQATRDAPVVADATKKPAKPRTTPTPKATDPATRAAPKPAATTADKPSAPTTKPAAPTTKPKPSATPTPREKNLIEILLGL